MKKVPFSAALQGENHLKGERCHVIGEEAKALKLVEQGRPDAVVCPLSRELLRVRLREDSLHRAI